MALSEPGLSRLILAGLWVWALALSAAVANQFLGYPIWKPPLDRMAIGLVENLRDLREIPGSDARASLSRLLANVRRARIEKTPVPVERDLEEHLAKPDSPKWAQEAEALHAKAKAVSIEWLQELGDFVVVPLLAETLDSGSESQRREAYALLLFLTQDLPGRPKPEAYAASMAPAVRGPAVAAWKEWVGKNRENL